MANFWIWYGNILGHASGVYKLDATLLNKNKNEFRHCKSKICPKLGDQKWIEKNWKSSLFWRAVQRQLKRSVLRGNLEGTHCGPKTAASSFTQPKNQKTYEYSLYRIQFDKFFFSVGNYHNYISWWRDMIDAWAAKKSEYVARMCGIP